MKLYCMDDEVPVFGSVSELQEFKSKIEAMSDGQLIELNFDTSSNTQSFVKLEPTMVIKVGQGPALSEYKKGLGIIFTGNLESLKVFASFFDFEEGYELGCHYHWDRLVVKNMLLAALFQ